jgi:hypothetical protein
MEIDLNFNSNTNTSCNIYYSEKNCKHKLYKTFRFRKFNNNNSSKLINTIIGN